MKTSRNCSNKLVTNLKIRLSEHSKVVGYQNRNLNKRARTYICQTIQTMGEEIKDHTLASWVLRSVAVVPNAFNSTLVAS